MMTEEAAGGVKMFPVEVGDGRVFAVRQAEVIREVALEVFLDGQRLVTIACNGRYTEELAVGFLRAEGLLKDRAEVARVDAFADRHAVQVFRKQPVSPAPASATWTIGSSGARGMGAMPVQTRTLHSLSLSITSAQVLMLMEALLNGSVIHNRTHGTHCSALAAPEGLLVLREDIGRHNTIDMLGGHMLMNDISGHDKILLTTGRISAEIVQKVWRLGIPIIISHSAPTSRALELLTEAGITLLGYVRGGRMNLYTEGKRVIR